MTLEAIEKRAALVHKPGDAHEYDLACKVCGQPGVIRLTIDPQVDMEAHLEYEALAAELRALRSSNEELRKALGEAVDVATWMSGSSSFSPEGEAAEGWEKARPKLDAARSLLVGEPAQALRRAADEVGS